MGLFLNGLCGFAADKHSTLAKSGNYKPGIVQLTPAEEAAILQKGGVSVPDGFEVTLFAPWQSANYPVYVAAAPNGDLYVSSDGCGSLGPVMRIVGGFLRLRGQGWGRPGR